MDHWCVVENFNMLEDPSNSMGGSTITISGVELAKWETYALNLVCRTYGILLQEG